MSEAPALEGDAHEAGAAFEAAVLAAQADIQSSVEKAGLRDDPYRYPLAALSHALGLFPGFIQQVRRASEEGRSPLEAAAVARVEKAAAAGAARYGADLARAQARRTAMLAGAILAGSVLTTAAVFGFGGYWWGHSAAVAQVHETEAGLIAAFEGGPDAAAGWMTLMQLNDAKAVLAACAGDRGFTDPSGRRACNAPLWVDAGKPPAPPKGR